MLRIDTPRASRSVHEMSTVSSDDMMGDLTSSDMEAPGSSLLTPDPEPPAPRRSSQSADEAQRALIELIDDVQHGELDYISSASELARTWYSLIKVRVFGLTGSLSFDKTYMSTNWCLCLGREGLLEQPRPYCSRKAQNWHG